MQYKKVFTDSRFRTKAQNSFNIDPKSKSIVVGSRNEGTRQTAFLGKVLEQSRTGNILDHNVLVDVSFPHVIGIFGSRGSGKSYDLGVMLEGIFLGDESATDAAVVFDIQDQFWTLGYQPSPQIPADASHIRDLSKWGLSPARVETLTVWVPQSSDTQVPNAVPFSLSAAQLTYEDWLAILELERFSPMGQALLTVLGAGSGGTAADLADLCDGAGVLNGFQQGTVDGLKWRLESLDAAEVIGTTGISADDLLRRGALTVILMRNLSESLRALIVGVVSRLISDRMGRVQQARKVAERTGESAPKDEENLARRFWMVLDEAHVLVPADGSTAATAPLIDYVKRGRDAGLSLVFATQQPSAVNSKLMSQVDLTLTHMLGFETDLAAASARMPTRTSVEYEIDNQGGCYVNDLLRSLKPGECVVADNASGRIFVSVVRPRSTAHGGATPE